MWLTDAKTFFSFFRTSPNKSQKKTWLTHTKTFFSIHPTSRTFMWNLWRFLDLFNCSGFLSKKYSKPRFGTFIFGAVFTPGFATQIVKLHWNDRRSRCVFLCFYSAIFQLTSAKFQTFAYNSTTV